MHHGTVDDVSNSFCATVMNPIDNSNRASRCCIADTPVIMGHLGRMQRQTKSINPVRAGQLIRKQGPEERANLYPLPFVWSNVHKCLIVGIRV